MEARRFLSFAQRLVHYQGAVRGYCIRTVGEQPQAPASQPQGELAETFDLTPEVLNTHPYFAGQFAGEVAYSQTSELPPVPVTNPHRDSSSAST